MGTTVQSITGRPPLGEGSLPQANGGAFYGPGQRVANWQQQQAQHSIGSPEAVFSPHTQSSVPPYQAQSQASAYEAQQAAGLHQQQQRGISQLQNAATTAAGLPVPRNAQTPTPGQQAAGMNGNNQQPGMEKRGPVEFNHAISYVNKIKASHLLTFWI
jgi:paired amphipathic helix protein Sin3a